MSLDAIDVSTLTCIVHKPIETINEPDFMKLIFTRILLSSVVLIPQVDASDVEVEILRDNFALECERNFSKSNLNVNIKEAPVKENNNESISAITALARQSNIIHNDKSLALGLTTTELSWEVHSELKSLLVKDSNLYCAQPNIEIEIQVLYHTVHVAKEFIPGSCEYNFVRNHELQHVEINNNSVRQYSTDVMSALHKRFSNKIFYGSPEEVNENIQQKMDNDWLPFVKSYAQKMEAERAKRHSLIDTPEEYSKAYEACSGGIAEIVQLREKSQ